jgi:23S rRNA pseudouridine2605 synthase
VKERLQKIVAKGGLASRRHAESWIVEGRVRVNGKIVRELGTQADPRVDKIEVDGKRVIYEQRMYFLFHKPRGVVSTLHDPEGRPTIREYLKQVPVRAFPVGRLDFATSGALLITNDGDFSDELLHPGKNVPKTYVVKVAGQMKEKDFERWRRGVKLEDGMTKPAEFKFLRYEESKTWFELTISEGRNQQIRRMGDATGFRVMRLARTEFAGVSTEELRPGALRALSRDELIRLKKAYGVPKKIPEIPTLAPARTAETRYARPKNAGRLAPHRAEESRERARVREPREDAAPTAGVRSARPERTIGARAERPGPETAPRERRDGQRKGPAHRAGGSRSDRTPAARKR